MKKSLIYVGIAFMIAVLLSFTFLPDKNSSQRATEQTDLKSSKSDGYIETNNDKW